MAIKHNYQPAVISISAGSAAKSSIPFVNKDGATTVWPLLLIDGFASYNGAKLPSAAVLVWTGTNVDGSIGKASYLTFTDATGYYGVTVKAGTAIQIKVYI